MVLCALLKGLETEGTRAMQEGETRRIVCNKRFPLIAVKSGNENAKYKFNQLHWQLWIALPGGLILTRG
jgi:hypothetical protein